MIKFLLLFILTVSTSFGSTTRTIDADSITSSDKTKTYSLPASTDTLTGRVSTDTLQNKTISGANNTLSQLPVASQYVRDGFSGNGSTTLFTLSQTPAVAASVEVFVNGLLQTQTTDYTISGTSLTMVSAPVLGQQLLVIYSRY